MQPQINTTHYWETYTSLYQILIVSPQDTLSISKSFCLYPVVLLVSLDYGAFE
ncbi:Uncharacterised protein [Yersinia enterocolitica]|uniref:Uncharacterized protein n=1 Tax=Yersinia enterocolitica TaxID=630 RepID=A0A0T7P8L5_YEREN|nr:Uncharacterised protein [Yersinia enterocolitica]CNJ90310.1 Uncharacterised protein [Yersinia enterocolitica]CQI03216.1 Uncharacterised protein [Yersinia enterocolitica]